MVLKVGVRHADPFEFLGWRFAIAAVCLFGAAGLLRRQIRLVHAREVIVVSLLQTTATFGLATRALVSGAVGRTAVLNYTMPFRVALLAWPLLGERPTLAEWGRMALIVAALAPAARAALGRRA